MLPNEQLKPVWDKLAWVYVYNDFKGSPKDQAADRIRIRCNVSSWPQLLLLDPSTLTVVGRTGRTVDSFLKQVASVKLSPSSDDRARQAIRRLQSAEQRAMQLQTRPTPQLAETGLSDPDVVVRALAVEYLSKSDPKKVLGMAPKLLTSRNDQLRYAVCRVVTDSPDGTKFSSDLRTRLESIAKHPVFSNNPNVLRIRAVESLGRCGGQATLNVIEPFALGPLNNGLTGVSTRAVGAIGLRDPAATSAAVELLLRCFPPATGDDPRFRETYSKRAVAAARNVHALLGKLTGAAVEFPAEYTEASRLELVRAFGAQD